MASSSARSFAHVGEHEVQLLRAWMAEGKNIKTMANLLQRDETTIRRQLKRMRVKSPSAPGWPPVQIVAENGGEGSSHS